jgi:chaperonin GroEL (HSP60 family)
MRMTNKPLEPKAVEEMRFDRGYISPYFTTNAEETICELAEPYILLHEKALSDQQPLPPERVLLGDRLGAHPLVPVLETILQTGKPLLVIAENVEGEPLELLVKNKVRGVLKACAVRAADFGKHPKATLRAIAKFTCSQVIGDELGIKLENVTLDMLGKAKKVVVTEGETIIIGGDGKIPAHLSPAGQSEKPTAAAATSVTPRPVPAQDGQIRKSRKSDHEDDQKLAWRIDLVLRAIKRQWPDETGHLGERQMARLLVCHEPKKKLHGFGEDAVRAIIRGEYRPMKRPAVKGLLKSPG